LFQVLVIVRTFVYFLYVGVITISNSFLLNSSLGIKNLQIF